MQGRTCTRLYTYPGIIHRPAHEAESCRGTVISGCILSKPTWKARRRGTTRVVAKFRRCRESFNHKTCTSLRLMLLKALFTSSNIRFYVLVSREALDASHCQASPVGFISYRNSWMPRSVGSNKCIFAAACKDWSTSYCFICFLCEQVFHLALSIKSQRYF